MKGGNEANAASGITHSPLGEPKRSNYDNKWFCQWMEGGNGVREANVVTLCSKCAYQTNAAENLECAAVSAAEEI